MKKIIKLYIRNKKNSLILIAFTISIIEKSVKEKIIEESEFMSLTQRVKPKFNKTGSDKIKLIATLRKLNRADFWTFE